MGQEVSNLPSPPHHLARSSPWPRRPERVPHSLREEMLGFPNGAMETTAPRLRGAIRPPPQHRRNRFPSLTFGAFGFATISSTHAKDWHMTLTTQKNSAAKSHQPNPHLPMGWSHQEWTRFLGDRSNSPSSPCFCHWCLVNQLSVRLCKLLKRNMAPKARFRPAQRGWFSRVARLPASQRSQQ